MTDTKNGAHVPKPDNLVEKGSRTVVNGPADPAAPNTPAASANPPAQDKAEK